MVLLMGCLVLFLGRIFAWIHGACWDVGMLLGNASVGVQCKRCVAEKMLLTADRLNQTVMHRKGCWYGMGSVRHLSSINAAAVGGMGSARHSRSSWSGEMEMEGMGATRPDRHNGNLDPPLYYTTMAARAKREPARQTGPCP